jgi:hypothetical protein
MANLDRYGLPISTLSDAAAEAYRNGIDSILSGWLGAGPAFDAAITADEAFALARVARARLLFLMGQGPSAKSEITYARVLAARYCNDREKSHVEVFVHGIEGRSDKSLACALAHLDTWPRDAFVMSLLLGAFGLFAFSGMSNHNQARVDLCEKSRQHYGDDWWFLTHLGWSHTENGNVRVGRPTSERALQLRKQNAHAVHGLVHAMFEDGSGDDVETLISAWLPDYDKSAILYSHISWHQALAALDKGDAVRALTIYTERIQPTVSLALPINVVSDTAGLLWRLQAYGNSVPKKLWEDAGAYATRAYPHAGFPFADMHLALIEAATGNRTALNARIETLEQQVSKGTLTAGAVVPAVCRAVLAFADNDYAFCAHILEPIAHEVVRLGGSHAQREVVEDTLLLALINIGEVAKARALLDQRLHRRHSPRDQRWRSAISRRDVEALDAAAETIPDARLDDADARSVHP